MVISKEQVTILVGMVASVEADGLDCEGCFGQIAEFADMYLAAREVPEAMQAVQTHLEQCLCCKDEFNALLKGLEEII